MKANKSPKNKEVEKMSWRRWVDFAPTDCAMRIPAPMEIIEKNKKIVLLICPAMDTPAATEASYAESIHTTRFVTTITKVTSRMSGSDSFKKLVD